MSEGSDGLHGETEGGKAKVSSDFGRRKIVETGLVQNICSSVSLSILDGRVWIGSSVKSCARWPGQVSVVAFERGSQLGAIEATTFSAHRSTADQLVSIVIPTSVVLGKMCFRGCKSLETVIFDKGSRLKRIEDDSFSGTALQSIEIPSSVVVLGKGCFCRCELLKSVTFESGSRLVRIEVYAFQQSGLKWIDIPSSIVGLARQCFYGCASLESVSVGTGSRLEWIEPYAFEKSGLKSIEIPGSVTFIDSSVFAYASVSFISVSPDNRGFRVRECFLETFDGSRIYRYFGPCRSIVIPSSVVVLGKWSFYNCKSLESVRFEGGSRLEQIEECAFQQSGLQSIEILSSVLVLGVASFRWCKALEAVAFEAGCRLERIEGRAFFGSGLKSVGIPSSVVELGKESFCKCASLESVRFESDCRLERIEESAFYESGLISVEIPSTVVAVGRGSFSQCGSLESVTFEYGSRLKRIEGSMFDGSYGVTWRSVYDEWYKSRDDRESEKR
jgi:hypothetical protein